MTKIMLALLCIGVASANTVQPNILFIICDDLGWNDVDFHGSAQIPTPHLTALATQNRSAVLDQYYVQPVCSPTRATVMTGRHVIHTGVYDPMNGGSGDLSLNFTLLPRYLKRLGYDTHMVGKWHLGFSSARFTPTERGFDTYFGYLDGASDYWSHGKVLDFWNGRAGAPLQPDFTWSCYVGGPAANVDCPEWQYSANVFTAKAQELLRSKVHGGGNNSAPWFMYLAYQSVHSPDEAPMRLTGRFNNTISNDHRRTFAGMVTALDEGIGNVTATLRETGQAHNTLIVFTTDNGGPADNFNGNMASNYPLRGMKRTLFEGGTRGVGFVAGHGVAERGAGATGATGATLSGLIHAADWLPTLLSAAAGPAAAAAMLANETQHPFALGDGVDQWPYLSGTSPPSRTEVLYEAHREGSTDGNGNALRVGRYKIVQRSGNSWSTGSAIKTNDGWYGGPGSSDPTSGSYAVNAGDVGALTVKCPLPPADLSSSFACVRNDSKTGYCLFDLEADPCEHTDLSLAQPDVLQRLVARLADYRAQAVPSNPDPHPNPDGPSCPGTIGRGSNRTRTICPNPVPTPAPAPVPTCAFSAAAAGVNRDGLGVDTGRLCLGHSGGGTGAGAGAGATGASIAPAIGACATMATSGFEWSAPEGGPLSDTGPGAAAGLCLKLLELPADAGCEKWRTLHLGDCQGNDAVRNRFQYHRGNGTLQSVRCPQLCLSTTPATANGKGAVAVISCTDAQAMGWRQDLTETAAAAIQ